jgi:hypothetical protein
MLSGKVVKIGSPQKFFWVSQQWKYFVLYVDHRGPTNNGTIGMSLRKIWPSCVAMLCCLAGLSVTFHWLSSDVACGSAKCSQFPVCVASWPDATNAFWDRFA